MSFEIRASHAPNASLVSRTTVSRTTTFCTGLPALLVLLAPITGLSESTPWSWILDPDSTEIRFELDATMHTVHGAAKLKRGEINIDPQSGRLSGEVVVDARSLTTSNKRRDRKMHERVLESETYPEIVLRPHGFTGALDLSRSPIVVQSRIVLLGQEHELDLRIEVEQLEGRLAARLSFDIPYVEWGLEDPSTLLLRVGKQVRVQIEAIGDRRPGRSSSKRP